VPRATYTGHLSVTYMDYTDQDTGRVLFAEPGGTYNIQATGFNAPDIPPDNFTRTDTEDNEDEEEPIIYDSAPEVEE
jgi:hypothetical protein